MFCFTVLPVAGVSLEGRVRLSPPCVSCSKERGGALSIHVVLQREPRQHPRGWSHRFASWLQRRACKSLLKAPKTTQSRPKKRQSGLQLPGERAAPNCLWSPLSPRPARLQTQPVVLETSWLQTPLPSHTVLRNCKRVCLWPACLERSLQQQLIPHCHFSPAHTYKPYTLKVKIVTCCCVILARPRLDPMQRQTRLGLHKAAPLKHPQPF